MTEAGSATNGTGSTKEFTHFGGECYSPLVFPLKPQRKLVQRDMGPNTDISNLTHTSV